jgi:hypothetical protein
VRGQPRQGHATPWPRGPRLATQALRARATRARARAGHAVRALPRGRPLPQGQWPAADWARQLGDPACQRADRALLNPSPLARIRASRCDARVAQWSPIYDIAAILTSIQSLLCDPNPNSPANSEAARLYQENRREYERKVKEIVEQSWQAEAEAEADE